MLGVSACLLIRNVDSRLNQEDPVELFREGFSDFLMMLTKSIQMKKRDSSGMERLKFPDSIETDFSFLD